MARSRTTALVILLALASPMALVHADNQYAAPVLDQAGLEQRIAQEEARKAQIDAEIAGLGDRRKSAQERLEERTRTLYRMTRSGYFPLAGGFRAMLDHVSRVSRMKRLVRAELSALENLRTRGSGLRDEVVRLATVIESDRAKLASMATQAVAQAEEARMATMFDKAFAGAPSRVPSTGITHFESGSIRVHDDGQSVRSTDFESLRGQLTLPLAGAREVREAQREDGMGVEFVGSPGAPVRAAADGKVVFAGQHATYGQLIIIDHGDRYFTVYAGVSSPGVREGDYVSRGAPLGAVAGGVLYVEVRRGTKSLDARAWLGV